MADGEIGEGPAMTAVGLVSTTAFLLSCGVHPDDLGEAWSLARGVKQEASHPSHMGPLVRMLRAYAAEREIARERALHGGVGRHTGAIPLE